MTNKIFRSVLIASVSVLLIAILIITGSLSRYFDSVQQKELRDELGIAVKATEKLGLTYLKELKSDRYRITWITNDGKVLYDTDVDASKMENHKGREEIKEALETGSGSSSRYSSTLTQKTLYEAIKLKNGTILRISVSQVSSLMLVFGMMQPIIIILIVAIVVSLILAKQIAKNIVKPFNNLDLENPMENDTYEELTPLLNRIHSQHIQIDKQLKELQWKKDEFNQIIAQMDEGLVLLNDKGLILSINEAAKNIFKAGEICIGQDFFNIDSSNELSQAIKKAQKKSHSELHICREGREYQINISKTISGSRTLGAVLLAFDVTEHASAERIRQEFTANVSHELKTPLQSISGSAELIENGLMKSEDIPRFARNIRTEASRLVELINDIIRLSQLDEGEAMPMEEIDIEVITKEIFAALQDCASLKNISMRVSGSAEITAVKRLMFEMLYNLCDNAVKYNRQNGCVDVEISQNESDVKISVSDTGIGIPKSHQSRVFERFYRVDKSHSKQSGGTGLGLSIVKHVVQYHHGTIELKSEENRGTTITVTLPKQSDI